MDGDQMRSRRILPSLLVVACLWQLAGAFSLDDLALYDLVEEVNANFYEFFGIEQTASLSQIKKAYRRLSLEYHPDRNDAPDAAEQFRKVAAIYDTLKNKESREKYDNVLEFGLPDWRQPIYYFRRARKLNYTETIVVLSLVFTIGHYLTLWGSYFEKTLVTKVNKKKRKDKKKGAVAEEEEGNVLDAFKPKFFDLLPFVVARGCWVLIKELKSHLEESLKKSKEIEEPDGKNEEFVRPKRATAEPVVYQVATGIKAVSTNDAKMEEKYLIEKIQNSVEKEVSTKGQKWSKEEISKLVKLSVTKYPVGSSNRWQNLARELNRSVDDITSAMEKLRKKEETFSLVSLQSQTKKADLSKPSEEAGDAEPKKSELEWTQNEQKLLEAALQHFPKGTPERWEKVASCIPNKTPAQCMERFKKLAEMVRQRKLQLQAAKVSRTVWKVREGRCLDGSMSFGAFHPSTSLAASLFPNCGRQQQPYQQAMSQQDQQLLRNCFSPTQPNFAASRKRHADSDMPLFGSDGFAGNGDVKRPRVSPDKLQRQLHRFHINDEHRLDEQIYSNSSSSDEEMMENGDTVLPPTENANVLVEEPSDPEEEANTPHFSLSTEAKEYIKQARNEPAFPFLNRVKPGALVLYSRANAFPRVDDPSMYGRIQEIEDGTDVHDGPPELPESVEFPDDDVATTSTSSASTNPDSPASYVVQEVDDDVDMEDMDMS